MEAADHPLNADLLEPFWRSDTMFCESLFFRRDGEDQLAAASLLFQPTAVLELISATGEVVFQEGVDYYASPAARQLVLTADTHIPFTECEELYSADGHEHTIEHLRGNPSVKLLFGEGRFFHDLQCSVTYTHAEKWDGATPATHGGALPRTARLLAAGDRLRLCMSGDSISAGGNASGFTDAPPHLSPYGELVTRGLQQRCGCPVVFTNLAVGGMGAAHGVEVAAAAAAARPDLMIIAYGMNDVGRGDPDAFGAQIRAGMEIIRETNPRVEFVLVAPMLGNPEWAHTPTEGFAPYRDTLASMCGEGVSLADMTQMWADLLRRKCYHDLTGNGVNHPNDFGHRIYAQVILSLLLG